MLLLIAWCRGLVRVCFGFDGSVRCDVFEIELLRELKVELDGGALVISLQRIGDGNVNLWSVEGPIAGIEFPLGPSLCCEQLQCYLQLVFGLVPRLDLAEEVIRTGRELELEGEAKSAVDCL